MADPPADPVRDTEGAITEYQPDRERRFEATDTGAEFLGDGTRWHLVSAEHEAWSPTGSIGASTSAIQLGPRGFPVVNQEYRGRLTSYEAGYTKPVFHWSFDGGARNTYEASSLFDRLDLVPTLAISPGLVGTAGRMDWAELRELVSDRGWGVSNHGFDHRRFDETEPSEQEREVVAAIEAFRRHGVPHQHYMYSWGMAGGTIGRSIVANVYPYAWGTTAPEDATGIRDVPSPYSLPRVFVERSDRATIEAAIDRAIEAETGMVLLGHNIRHDEPVDADGFETPVELISHLASYVREAGGEWVESVDEVLRYSRTPIRIAAGEEPVRIDHLAGDRATLGTLSRDTIGAVRTITADRPVSGSEWVTIDFDQIVYDDFKTESGTDSDSVCGTYHVDLRMTLSTTDAVEVRLLAGDESIAREQVAPSAATTVTASLQAYPRLGTDETIEVQVRPGESVTVHSGRDRSRLALLHLG